jgi:ubiquinone/menaquinone biosynthesis C-methylase UbiE
MNEAKQWWNKNVPTMENTLYDWIEDHTALTKRVPAEYFAKIGNKKTDLLDVACANQTFKKSLEIAGYKGKYTGCDSCELLIEKYASDRQDIENMDYPDGFFDFVFARHILEHLPEFQKGFGEVLRVARKNVVVVFFNLPAETEQIRIENNNGEVYTNIYSLKEIEEFIKSKGWRIQEKQQHNTELIMFLEK